MTNVKDHLAQRRSIAIPSLKAPAPTGDELDAILTLAVRVPDHGKLAPWRFILIRDKAAERLGATMAEIAARKDGELSEGRRNFELDRFTRAPLVVAVVSSAREHFKIPQWEQVLSAGAVTMNLIHAVHAHGYAANWITEWPAYDEEAKAALGIQPDEKVAGFVYIGTPEVGPTERPRPALADIVSEANGA
ncbi:nitroreductase family protein [Aureimonas mangrovi]|uniref:nitroreductase family protein n=1 Tax=Aureimonas mangrovi TaxID=2758041 RepID=UPI00163DB9A4|nr:nitroreductase [Aureimonas mangrovi]